MARILLRDTLRLGLSWSALIRQRTRRECLFNISGYIIWTMVIQIVGLRSAPRLISALFSSFLNTKVIQSIWLCAFASRISQLLTYDIKHELLVAYRVFCLPCSFHRQEATERIQRLRVKHVLSLQNSSAIWDPKSQDYTSCDYHFEGPMACQEKCKVEKTNNRRKNWIQTYELCCISGAMSWHICSLFSPWFHPVSIGD